MNDIVEELKRGAEMEEEYDTDGIIRIGYKRSLRYRAAAEIERLRDRIIGLEAAMDARTPELCAKDAEIERLRADLLTARGEAEDMSAEIERLRKIMDDAEDVMKRQRDERLAQKNEIERLNGTLRELWDKGRREPGLSP